jgi:hypothetical protein
MSIRAMLFGVLFIAGNCAALRLVIRGYPPLGLVFGVFFIVPMSNILAVACYRSLTRRTSARPFFVGFELSGALAILVCFNFCLTADEKRLMAMNAWLSSTLETIYLFENTNLNFGNLFINMLCYSIIFSVFVSLTALPQMLVALTGGWIARRYAAISNPTIPSVPASR